LFALHAGDEAAIVQVRRRAGSHLDPDLCQLFLSRTSELVEDLDDVDAYEYVLHAEPNPVRLVDDDGLQAVARTFGELVDLKSPWLHGHSAGVAELAAAAVRNLGLEADMRAVRIAGHLHDLGRVGVSSRIWDKPGRLSQTERDQVRLHPYHSERILCRVSILGDVATLAGQHHERCDGSGYHRGVSATQLTMPSRVLAAADTFRSLIEDRPHRPAFSVAEAADRLRTEARSGGLDGDAVTAVLRASGQRTGVRRSRPADLTDRQVEVLRLLAAGMSNRDIAERLVISSRTAEHHVQDIYLKIGASTRAAAALFAMEHGLLKKLG
jgi:HD-GYP domain-containing protein (c-di-GMP phosphodiesterase class II)